uniref:Protein eva-1 homolog C n=1 Tax=Cacopsylla melanoneura TaxID=428564 RepID=A0A8D9DZT9_9HEMI
MIVLFLYSHILLGLMGLKRVSNADNLALLSGTLRTFQKVSCEDQLITLKCPPSTRISIQLSQYIKPNHEYADMCHSSTQLKPKHHNSSLVCSPFNGSTALQYSLLQTVVEACQKKRTCKIQASARMNNHCIDGTRTVEIDYKCQPHEFRSKVACENDIVQLDCQPYFRIAIYSASYGRTEYESLQCPQRQGVPEETCLVSYATETVMQLCHGKRMCKLATDTATFGNPCRPESRMYLRVVFTCVPRKVLRDLFDERNDEEEATDEDPLDIDGDVEDALLPSPKREGGRLQPNSDEDLVYPTPYVQNISRSAVDDPKGDKDLLLIVVIILTVSLLIGILIVVNFVMWQRSRRKQVEDKKSPQPQGSNSQTSVPPNILDEFNDIENAIDFAMAIPVPIVSPYHHHTLGEVIQIVCAEETPRSLSSKNQSSQYYYG